MANHRIALAVLLLLLPSAAALASPQVGTLTSLQGEVKLFYNPSSKVDGPPPHALFEGVYYSVRDAKVGDRLERGTILRTHPAARARVIFDNGDQFHVAPGSSFSIGWDHDEANANSVMDLRYGKARAVIERGGPRSHFVIRTRSAVMGVRGTDFFIAVNGQTNATETATLRGAVQVTPQAAPGSVAAPPVEVKVGETASTPLGTAEKPATVQLHRTTEPELKVIERTSIVKNDSSSPPLTEELAQQVRQLETAAATTTLKDIQRYDGPLYAQLDKLPSPGSMDSMNLAVVDELKPAAPKEQGQVGPITDLAGSEDSYVAPVPVIAPAAPLKPANQAAEVLPPIHRVVPVPASPTQAQPRLSGPRPASPYHFLLSPQTPARNPSSEEDDSFDFRWGTWDLSH